MSGTITYSSNHCDTLQSIAERFQTSAAAIFLLNPELTIHPQGVTLPEGQDRYEAAEGTRLETIAKELRTSETALFCHHPALPFIDNHDDSHAWYELAEAFPFQGVPRKPMESTSFAIQFEGKAGDELAPIAAEMGIAPSLLAEILGAHGVALTTYCGDSSCYEALVEDISIALTFDLPVPTGFIEAGSMITIPTE